MTAEAYELFAQLIPRRDDLRFVGQDSDPHTLRAAGGPADLLECFTGIGTETRAELIVNAEQIQQLVDLLMRKLVIADRHAHFPKLEKDGSDVADQL